MPLLFAALACESDPQGRGAAERARELSREILIVDTHIDVPYRLTERGMEDVGSRTERGDFDYPRAVEGGLDLAFMSIYTPASYQESGGGRVFADELIELVEEISARQPQKFVLVTEPEQVALDLLRGRVGLALGMENGAPIEDDLSNLGHFFDRGVRYITLTHSKNNQICDSSYDDERRWNGLSPFGREVVAEMNRLGIMVDVSHVTDETFYQVMELSRAPVIASHSSCRHFTPGWGRNMDDAMIRKLGEKNGVIQINFGSGFLLHAAREQSTAFWEEYERFRDSNGLDEHDPRLAEFEQAYWRDHERIYADVSDVAAHIDHVVELAGIDHVGFGSDFDGVGDSLPSGLKDVSYYPNLIRELLERGYSMEDVEKICAGNLLRVWSEVRRVAEELRREG